MHIDKYKKGDGYESENGVFYEDALSFLHTKILGFCGCGNLEDNLIFIGKGLTHINNRCSNGNYHKWYKAWIAEGRKIFGNEASRYFFFYWCDGKRFTEHGGSIPGWLTKFGLELLQDINELNK